DEFLVLLERLVGYLNLFFVQEFPEFCQNVVAHLEIPRNCLVDSQVVLGEIKEGTALKKRLLSWRKLLVVHLDIRGDAATPVHFSATIRESDLRVGGGGELGMVVVV